MSGLPVFIWGSWCVWFVTRSFFFWLASNQLMQPVSPTPLSTNCWVKNDQIFKKLSTHIQNNRHNYLFRTWSLDSTHRSDFHPWKNSLLSCSERRSEPWWRSAARTQWKLITRLFFFRSFWIPESLGGISPIALSQWNFQLIHSILRTAAPYIPADFSVL